MELGKLITFMQWCTLTMIKKRSDTDNGDMVFSTSICSSFEELQSYLPSIEILSTPQKKCSFHHMNQA